MNKKYLKQTLLKTIIILIFFAPVALQNEYNQFIFRGPLIANIFTESGLTIKILPIPTFIEFIIIFITIYILIFLLKTDEISKKNRKFITILCTILATLLFINNCVAVIYEYDCYINETLSFEKIGFTRLLNLTKGDKALAIGGLIKDYDITLKKISYVNNILNIIIISILIYKLQYLLIKRNVSIKKQIFMVISIIIVLIIAGNIIDSYNYFKLGEMCK